jgi:selenocysteine lyase/cysteine desulfurase
MIYLDHAATSFPKPAAVLAAMQHWFADVGVSAERGDGPRTQEAARVLQQTRQLIAALTGHRSERVAFCSGATEGLNLVLRALLAPKSTVLTTTLEHASVIRPLLALQQERSLQVEVADREQPGISVDDALCEALLRLRPATLVFSHASNVTGAVLDAQRICAVARAQGTITILDASQTAGYLPLTVGADLVVASGHKALHGPPGIGFVSAGADLELLPQKFGGTGSSAALERHPTQWPQAFEAGTPNTPAIFGLAAALQWLDEQGPAVLLGRALQVLQQIERGLDGISGVRVLSANTRLRMPVISFVHQGYDALELGAVLAANQIHARAGYHCAPWIHAGLGTTSGGTVRIATGPDTSSHDADALLAVLATL